MLRRIRRGVTKVEVAIVLLIAVTLLGLFAVFLPQSRQTSFRAHCANNLKRLGEGIVLFHGTKEKPGGRHGFLPAARIAEDYATWPVQLAPFVAGENPLAKWDMQRRFEDQSPEVREAVLSLFFCPARPRPTLLGKNEADVQGALGDYACVAGNGDPRSAWTGPHANGPIILGEVLEQQGGLIVRWRGRTSFKDLEKRGSSYTFLLGEKHVPWDQWGDAAAGDGPFYDGSQPAFVSRVAGTGYGLAASLEAAFNFNFGSAHPGLCHFLVADGSVSACAVDMDEEVLGAFARRGE